MPTLLFQYTMTSNIYYDNAIICKSMNDYKNMKKNFERGIKQGCNKCLEAYADACYDLQDFPEMLSLYNKLISKGIYSTYLKMGKYYYTIYDREKSKECYELAIKNGIYEAYYELGAIQQILYDDDVSAEHLYATGYAHDDMKSTYALGSLYKLRENYDIMKKILNKSCKMGCELSAASLGHYYDSVEQNYVLSAAYYEKAISYGSITSYYACGMIYEKMNKIDKANQKYYEGFRNKCHKCSFSLGLYYDKIKDYPKMLFYLSYASEKCIGAYFKIASYYKSIDDDVNMIKYLNEGEKKNDTFSTMALAIYYQNKNIEKAIHYYYKCITLGFQEIYMFFAEFITSIEPTHLSDQLQSKLFIFGKMLPNTNYDKQKTTEIINMLSDYYYKHKQYYNYVKLLSFCAKDLKNASLYNKIARYYVSIKNTYGASKYYYHSLYMSYDIFTLNEFTIYMKTPYNTYLYLKQMPTNDNIQKCIEKLEQFKILKPQHKMYYCQYCTLLLNVTLHINGKYICDRCIISSYKKL